MFEVVFTTKFKKDYKIAKKRGKDIKQLQELINLIAAGKPIPDKHRDHVLIGNYANRRECHINPDWLLIYKIIDNQVIFERTGSHSDLFKC